MVVPSGHYRLVPDNGRIVLRTSRDGLAATAGHDLTIEAPRWSGELVVKDDGTVEARVVRPGPIIDGLRVVRDGLKPEDRVVIDGLMRARAGAKVTPQPGKIEPDPQAS